MATKAELYNLGALFGVSPGADIANAIANPLFAAIDAEMIADYMIETYTSYGSAGFVDSFAADILGADHAMLEVSNTVIAQLAADGLSAAEIAVIALDFLLSTDDAAFADVRATLENRAVVAEYYADNGADLSATALDSVDETQDSVDAIVNAPVVTDGDEFMLTASTDVLTGTSGDDSFMAYLSQNSMIGGISNSLSSADRLDGGDGADTLWAELTQEFVGSNLAAMTDIQIRSANIETIAIEARDDGDNDLAEEAIVIDMKHATDVRTIESSYSDGDLVFENVTTLNSDGSIDRAGDMTIIMNHTDNMNSDEDASDLTVYFDEDYLFTTSTPEGSSLRIDMVDAIALGNGENPLTNITEVSFLVDGVEQTVPVSVLFDGTESVLDAYTLVRDTLQAAVDTLGVSVNVVLGNLTDAVYTIDIDGAATTGTVAGQYYPILLTATDETILDEGVVSQNTAASNTDINATQTTVDQTEVTVPLSVNIELEKVGRDGEGGNLVVGGKDQGVAGDGEEDQTDGITIFNIEVGGNSDQPSDLGFISSTDQALETVNIDDRADWAGASLRIRDAFNGTGWTSNATNVEMVDANGFSGDLIIGDDTFAMNVDTFTATGGGDIGFYHSITGDERGVFSTTTGGGDDTIQTVLDGDAVDTVGTSYSIVTGSGADEVTVAAGTTVANNAGVSHNTTEDLDNLSISTGAGADEITLVGGSDAGLVNNAGNTDGDANFNISAGADSDFVRIESEEDSDSTALVVGVAQVGTVTITGAEVTGGDDTVDFTITDAGGTSTFTATVAAGQNATAATVGAVTNVASTATYTATVLNGVVTITSDTVGLPFTVGTVVTTQNAEIAAGALVTTVAPVAAVAANADLNGSWMVGALTENQPWVDRVLYNATLTVNFAGFEETVTIATDADGNYIADQLDINDAVIAAIAANPELSQLLSVTKSTGSQALLITSTVEGHNDLTISVNQPTVAAASIVGTVLTGLQNGLVETGVAADSAAADTAAEIEALMAPIAGNLNETGAAVAAPDLVLDTGDGTDGANETNVTNYSVIDMGTGANDLVALNSDVDSVNTLDFTAIWDKVSVVNWFEAQATAGNDVLTDAVTGNHVLDFTVWLDDQTSTSGSALSAVRTATTSAVVNVAAADLDLGSNEVVIFNAFTQNTGESETWASMTAADVDASLEGTDNFGTANFGNVANVNAPTAYPTTNLLDSILMVENDLNAGEYKVFNVETNSTAAAGSQHTVTLLGVIDFGETLNAGVADANFA